MVAGSAWVKGISQGPASPTKYFEAEVAVFLVSDFPDGWVDVTMTWLGSLVGPLTPALTTGR